MPSESNTARQHPMSDLEKTAERQWMVGLTNDSRDNTVGISLRRAFNRNGEWFAWKANAPATDIAIQLRAAADYLEDQDRETGDLS